MVGRRNILAYSRGTKTKIHNSARNSTEKIKATGKSAKVVVLQIRL